jgi:hypothetical protein
LTLQAKQDGNPATAVSGNVDLTLYGPSDVIGIDPRLVVRTDPKPNVTNFEPNYLAVVDFDPPDFPWLLTPAHADGTEHLRPWLVLVARACRRFQLSCSNRPDSSIANWLIVGSHRTSRWTSFPLLAHHRSRYTILCVGNGRSPWKKFSR